MASTSGWPNSYVRGLHAGVSTPIDILDRLTRQATGRRLDAVRRIVDGYENEVYRVRTVGERDVMIRIKRFGGDLDESLREARAIEQARSVGMPAPELLLVDTVVIDGTAFPVMVQRVVPGRALVELYDELGQDQRHRVLVQIGRMIAGLTGIPVDGDWTAGTASEVAKRRAERALVITAGFSDHEVDQLMTALDRYPDRYPCPDPVLCHGDLSPKHIFVDDELRVTGVIDFGDTHAGSPVDDLAVLRVRGPALSLDSLLAGFRRTDIDGFRQRLDLHTLLIALGSLAIGVDENDAACVQRVVPLIRRILTALQHDG